MLNNINKAINLKKPPILYFGGIPKNKKKNKIGRTINKLTNDRDKLISQVFKFLLLIKHKMADAINSIEEVLIYKSITSPPS
ncbi:hypothetical protein [Staphylococcus felis]|uniref:Uncharacterized protein n=1 Tax=Staphylococcus felis TaxID=46127 RepID=A0A3E0IS82_9STAP|nr:hypothetical protein [Staphylococcus felis]REH86946.1 hypothetical protein DOS61_01705 [Staphylococcus felis]REH92663.1 hypothetical protein DOS58_00715 [Staphylococcus felis]REH99757.1 hypothetical protein DOS83_01845 [Staphylococcus felis]